MSSSNVSSVTNHFSTAAEGFTTTLSSTASSGAATLALTSVSGLTNGNVFVGIIEPGTVGKEQTFTGTVDTSGSQITGVVWTRGSNTSHIAGVTVVDYVSGTGHNMMTKGLLAEHNQDGTHSDITADSLTVSGTSVLTGAVTLPDSTVTTAKINDGAVTSEKLKATVGFYATTTQTINNSATADVTTYTEVVDYGADFDHTTGVFTAPVAGLYHFDVNMSVTDVGSAGGRVESNLLVNGSAKGHGFGQGAATNNDPSMNQSITISLAANDAVKVSITNNSGANEPLVDASFSGFLVGRP